LLRGRELLLGAVDIERFERIDYFQRRVDIESKGVHLERLAIGVVKRGGMRSNSGSYAYVCGDIGVRPTFSSLDG
jgi:hypothetical protein